MASTFFVLSDQSWDCACLPSRHLLLRLARQHAVVFIEAPRHHPGHAFLQMDEPQPNVRVVRLHTPVQESGFHHGQLAHLRPLLRTLERESSHAAMPGPDAGNGEIVAWFCNPLAFPLLPELDAALVIADCSERPLVPPLAQQGLREQEHALLSTADLILTAAPSRFRELRARHAHVHCLSPGTEVRHFEPALDRANSHPLHRGIPGPRLGYHGVIDARIDLDLIRHVADAHPRWQIVLVGPVVGMPLDALPRRANIHYLGPQPYEELPRFLAGWDVCLLPFAQSAAGDINPAVTLPCLAAELPVVATHQPDLLECHGSVISSAANARDFVTACERALLAGPEERTRLVADMRRLLALASCDASAAEVVGLLRVARQRRLDALAGQDVVHTVQAFAATRPPQPGLSPHAGDPGASVII